MVPDQFYAEQWHLFFRIQKIYKINLKIFYIVVFTTNYSACLVYNPSIKSIRNNNQRMIWLKLRILIK